MTTSLSTRMRSYPLFFASAGALVLVAAVAGADLFRQLNVGHAARADLERLRIEQLTPQARPEMVAAARVAVEQAREQLWRRRACWPGVAEAARPDRLESYAALVSFVERSRAAAVSARVAVAKDERFGFAQHANEGPAADKVAVVLAQMRAVERVLTVLFSAGPERLLQVRRENPEAESGAREGEWCRLERSRSVGTPGVAQARAIGVEFSGRTACLRKFLNGLAAAPGLVVREVRAGPLDERPELARFAARIETQSLRFAVLVEAVEVTGGGAVDGAAGADAPAPWPEPLCGDDSTSGPAELFSPRALVFNAETKNWKPAAIEAARNPEPGFELLAVRQVLPRWRLVGHAGDEGARVAMVEEVAGRRMVLLRVGGRDAASGVVLESLEVEAGKDGGRVVRATLADPGAGGPVVLTTGAPERRGRFVGVLQVPGGAGPVEVREGETARLLGADYVIGPIGMDPGTVEITRLAGPGRRAETTRLKQAAPR